MDRTVGYACVYEYKYGNGRPALLSMGMDVILLMSGYKQYTER